MAIPSTTPAIADIRYNLMRTSAVDPDCVYLRLPVSGAESDGHWLPCKGERLHAAKHSQSSVLALRHQGIPDTFV